MSSVKTPINIVVIGHVDSGKSTSTGHLIYKCGGIDKRTIEKFEKEAQEMKKGSFKYAWILDKLKPERERGLSIDLALYNLSTAKFLVTLIDSPGNKQYVKNMITAASHADCAVLVLSAKKDEFETGMRDGMTREHVLLARVLGVKQMIVGINKMDLTEPPFSEKRFDEIKKEVSNYLKKVGYQPDGFAFVPISGWNGDNMVEESTNMAWYKGWEITRRNAEEEKKLTGKTLLDALDAIQAPERSTDKPLRLPVGNVFVVEGSGTIIAGRVEAGSIKTNMDLTITPQGLTTRVRSIRIHGETVSLANAGDIVTVQLSGIPADKIHRGNVLSNSRNDPARPATDFQAKIFLYNLHGKIRNNTSVVVDIHNEHVECVFTQLIRTFDPNAINDVLNENPDELEQGDVALVGLRSASPICLETSHEYPQLGRFAIRDQEGTVGGGIITNVIR